MNVQVLNKIKSIKGAYEYLHDHSYWYNYLNMSGEYLNDFLKEFRKNKREEQYNKFNSTLDNIELLSNLIKFVD